MTCNPTMTELQVTKDQEFSRKLIALRTWIEATKSTGCCLKMNFIKLNSIMEIRSIKLPEDREAVMGHVQAVHGPDNAELLSHWYRNSPNLDPEDIFVIEGEQGQIISHAML